MKRFFTSALILVGSLFLWNCKNDDNRTEIAERDRQEVYNENINEIESFLKTNSIEILEEGVQFDSVAFESNHSIWKQTDYPLQSVLLKNDTYNTAYKRIADNVEYTVYYLIINEGGGEKPFIHDNVFTSYNGYLLDGTSFDSYPFGVWSGYPANGSATEFISGYRQILQQVKTADGVIDNGDGTYSYENPGRVIVFIPSGLGYFNNGNASVSNYTPIIFDIKLISLKEIDHDKDGILTKYEDVDGNGNLWDDDTDADGKPDFLDTDDDGDGYTTREEITYTVEENGEIIKKLYSFDEIPTCSDGMTKKHLDKSCH